MTKDVKLWEEKKAFTIGKWTAIIIFVPWLLFLIGVAIFIQAPFNWITIGNIAELTGMAFTYAIGYGLFIGLVALGVIKFRNWRHLKA